MLLYKSRLISIIYFILGLIIFLPSASYAADYSHGDACAVAGAWHQTNNADGMDFLICDGANWKSALTFSSSGNNLRIDNDPATGSAGCIQYDGTNSKLQYSDDCLSYSDFGSAGGSGVAGDYQVFTASGTWTKPSGLPDDQLVVVEVWGGGGGGGSNGGGGGAYNRQISRAGDLGTTVSVTVGAGGASGVAGGDSSFGTYVYAYGGGHGNSKGGGGGGIGSAGGSNGGDGGDPIGGAKGDPPADSIYGGGGGNTGNIGGSAGGSSVYGGGGGGSNSKSGGSSVYGGGGGGGGGGGTSIFGGNGGGSSTAGSVPGGGGGTNAAGARGEVRVWVVPAGGGSGGSSLWSNGAGDDIFYNSGSAPRVGIAVSSPDVALDVGGTIQIADGGESCAAGLAGAIKYASSNVYFCNGSAWTQVGAGGGMPGGADTQIQFNSSGSFDGSANLTWNNATGKLTVNGDIDYTGYLTDVSDRRLKENIAPLENSLAGIMALQGYSFSMKNDPEHEIEYGLMAQDVQPIFPELVKTNNDGRMSLNYIGMIGPLVEATKTQQETIEAQASEINNLRARLEALEARYGTGVQTEQPNPAE